MEAVGWDRIPTSIKADQRNGSVEHLPDKDSGQYQQVWVQHLSPLFMGVLRGTTSRKKVPSSTYTPPKMPMSMATTPQPPHRPLSSSSALILLVIAFLIWKLNAVCFPHLTCMIRGGELALLELTLPEATFKVAEMVAHASQPCTGEANPGDSRFGCVLVVCTFLSKMHTQSFRPYCNWVLAFH